LCWISLLRLRAERSNHVLEWSVALILRDLRNAGYITGTREGRRVYYSVDPSKPLRTDSVQHRTVGELLELLTEAEATDREKSHPSQKATPAEQQEA
jgi:DNA-binding transcriptional ArsR family regulator